MALRRDDGGSEMSTALLARMVESTCRIELVGGSCGSGSLVNIRGTACVLTNHHVLQREEDAEEARAIFMDFLEQESVVVRLDPSSFWATSPGEELDFTFCALKGAFPRLKAGRKLMPLKLSYKVPKENDAVIIVQFPRGGQRKHAVQRISETEGDFTYYLCDTDYGSSGSPVFCGDEVVALHHRRSTTKKANRGVVMAKVMRRLLQIMKQQAAQLKKQAPAPAPAASKSSEGEGASSLANMFMNYLKGSSESNEQAEVQDFADFLHNDGKATSGDGKANPAEELIAGMLSVAMSPLAGMSFAGPQAQGARGGAPARAPGATKSNK